MDNDNSNVNNQNEDASNIGGLANLQKTTINNETQQDITVLVSTQTFREQSQQDEGILSHLERAATIAGFSDSQNKKNLLVPNLSVISLTKNNSFSQISLNFEENDINRGAKKRCMLFQSNDGEVQRMNSKNNDEITNRQSIDFSETSLCNNFKEQSKNSKNCNGNLEIQQFNKNIRPKEGYGASYQSEMYVKSLLSGSDQNSIYKKDNVIDIQPIPQTAEVGTKLNIPNINRVLKTPKQQKNLNTNSTRKYTEIRSHLSIIPSQIVQQKQFKYTTLINIKKFIRKLKKSITLNRYYDLKSHHLKLINDLSYDPNFIQESTMQQLEQGQKRIQTVKTRSSSYSKMYKLMNFEMIYDRYLKNIVISSQSIFSICFELVLLLTVCIQIFLVPFMLCFKLSESTLFDTLVIFSFPILFSEILLRCITSYYKEGLEVRKQQKILKRYLKNYFLGDFVTLLALCISFQSGSTWISLFFLLKIKRIPKLINKINDHFQLEFRFPIFFELLKLFLLISAIAHFCGCGFCFLGQFGTDNNEKSWLLAKGIQSADWSEKYLYGLYFSFITMITVGYGDITPQTNKEIMYVLFMTLISTGTFGYSINTIGSIFRELQIRKSEIKKQKHSLSSYMISRNISKTVQIKVQKEFEHYQVRQQQNWQNGDMILSQLSSDVKNSVKQEYYGRILEKYKILTLNFSKEFLSNLSLKLKEMFLSPDEVVLQQGELMNRIICLISGELIAFVESSTNKFNHIPIGKIKKGEFSDQRPLFFEHNLGYGLKSAGICQIAYFTHEDFTMTLRSFPQEYEKFCMLRDNIQHQQIFIDLKCFCCGNFGHSTNNCSLVHFKKTVQNIEKREKSIDQQRSSYKRSLFSYQSLKQRQIISQQLKSYRISSIQEIIPFYKPYFGDKLKEDQEFYYRVPRISIKEGKTIVEIKDNIEDDEGDDQVNYLLLTEGSDLQSRNNQSSSPFESTKTKKQPKEIENVQVHDVCGQIQPYLLYPTNQQTSPQTLNLNQNKTRFQMIKSDSFEEKESQKKVVHHFNNMSIKEKNQNPKFASTSSSIFQDPIKLQVEEENICEFTNKQLPCKLNQVGNSQIGCQQKELHNGIIWKNKKNNYSIQAEKSSSEGKIHNNKIGNPSNSIQHLKSISPFGASCSFNMHSTILKNAIPIVLDCHKNQTTGGSFFGSNQNPCGSNPISDFHQISQKNIDSMLMDMSLFGSQIENFDQMRYYKIYFPHGNMKDIVDELCKIQIERIRSRKDIKRSFKHKVVKNLKQFNFHRQDAFDILVSTSLPNKSRKISNQLIRRKQFSIKSIQTDQNKNPSHNYQNKQFFTLS